MTMAVPQTNGAPAPTPATPSNPSSSIQRVADNSPIRRLQAEFSLWRPALQAVLPAHLKVDRIIKMATAAFMRNEGLQKCTLVSVIKATVVAAELGLEPGSLLGEAYIVPYKRKIKVRDGNVYKDQYVDEAQLVPGYRGLIKLARQSGDVSTVAAYVVDEADDFQVRFGLDPDLQHTPNLKEKKGTILAAYAVIKFRDGGVHFDVMTLSEIEAIRQRSPSGESGPWRTDYAEMAKKTVLKRALKMVTMSSEKPQTAIAIAADNSFETGSEFSTELTDALEAHTDPETGEVTATTSAAAPGPAPGSRTGQLVERVERANAKEAGK